MERLSKIYTNDDSQTFQLLFQNNRKQFNSTLAAFLILRGKHALLQYDVIGPYECASEACGVPGSPGKGGYGPYVWSSMLDLDYGVPVAAPTVSADGNTWTRKWSKATITLDCAAHGGAAATFAFNQA